MDAVKLVTRASKTLSGVEGSGAEAQIIFGLASLIRHMPDTRKLKNLEAGIQYS